MIIKRVFPCRLSPGLQGSSLQSIGRFVLRVPRFGVLEGFAYAAGKGAPEVPVVCAWGNQTYWIQEFTRSDESGYFVVGPVPCGEIGVGRVHGKIPEPGDEYEEELVHDVERRVNVLPGKVTFVELGAGSGRVAGRLTIPHDQADSSGLAMLPRLWLECLAPYPDPEMNIVSEYAGLKLSSDEFWDEDLAASAPGRTCHRWYHVEVRPDGTFVREDILPGDYGLRLECGSPDTPLSGPVAVGFARVMVEGDHDLGDIEVPRWVFRPEGRGRIYGILYRDGQSVTRGVELLCQVSVLVADDYGDGLPGRAEMVDEVEVFARTGPGGAFSFESLPPGEVMLGTVLRRGEDSSSTQVLAEIELGDGEEVELELHWRA